MSLFLASVADAQIFYKMNRKMYQVATCKTLTDSNFSFSSTQEEIRAGSGGKLCGRFSHSSGLNIELTNAMFDLDTLAWQVGKQVQQGAITTFIDEKAQIFPEGFYLSKIPTPIGNCSVMGKAMVWYTVKDCEGVQQGGVEVKYSPENHLWIPVGGQSLESVIAGSRTYIVFNENMAISSSQIQGLQINREGQKIFLNGEFKYPDAVEHSRAAIVLDQQILAAGRYIIDIAETSLSQKDVYLCIRSENGRSEEIISLKDSDKVIFTLSSSDMIIFELLIPNNSMFENDSFSMHVESRTSSCEIKYFTHDMNARSLSIGANLFPKELILMLTAQLFAGDSKQPELGQPVGQITIKIPRFSLDGSFELPLNIASSTPVTLKGVALVDKFGEAYAEVVEFIKNVKGKYLNLIISDIEDWVNAQNFQQGEQMIVYGTLTNGELKQIDPSELIFTPLKYFSNDGTILSTPNDSEFPIYVTVREKSNLQNYSRIIINKQ